MCSAVLQSRSIRIYRHQARMVDGISGGVLSGLLLQNLLNQQFTTPGDD